MTRPLELAVGERCQDRCVFCTDVPDVPVVVPADRIVLRMREARARGATTLQLSGLEPTLRPDFVALVDTARTLGYETIQVVTNARRFACRGFADEAVGAGLNAAIVSIHGHRPEIERAITGEPESFEEKAEGTRNLAAAFLRARLGGGHHENAVLEANTVVTRANLAVLGEVVAFLSGLGVARINLHATRPFGWALRHFDRAVPPMGDAARAAVDAARRARALGTPVFVCDFPPCLLRDAEDLAGSAEDKEVLAVSKSGEEERQEGLFKKARDSEKGEPCSACRVAATCNGINREYALRRGWSEIRPL